MTIEELLELPAKDIAQLTDAQLASHLRKYFPFTRPAGVLDNALSVALNKRTAQDSDGLSLLEQRLAKQHEEAKAAAARSAITIKRATPKV